MLERVADGYVRKGWVEVPWSKSEGHRELHGERTSTRACMGSRKRLQNNKVGFFFIVLTVFIAIVVKGQNPKVSIHEATFEDHIPMLTRNGHNNAQRSPFSPNWGRRKHACCTCLTCNYAGNVCYIIWTEFFLFRHNDLLKNCG